MHFMRKVYLQGFDHHYGGGCAMKNFALQLHRAESLHQYHHQVMIILMGHGGIGNILRDLFDDQATNIGWLQ
jgi:hypothetical protein